MNPGQGSWGKQFVNSKPEASGNLFEGDQAGVLFYSKLVKLIELVADAASFRGLLLRPPAG